MNTISSSNVPSGLSGAADRKTLGRSLIDLSARARPAAADLPGEDESGVELRLHAHRQVAFQNRFSALADGAAASGATQTAVSSLSGQPDTALVTQANASPEAAWALLQQND